MAVTFAVGAVTGTVLTFEFGLLWPKFMGQWGAAFGIPFAIEGLFFFIEAIFIAIYIFGWKRLRPWPHFWTGVPIVHRRHRRHALGRRRQRVDERARRVHAEQRGRGRRRRPAEGDLQRRVAVRGVAHARRRVPRRRLPGRVGLRGRHAARAAATATTGSASSSRSPSPRSRRRSRWRVGDTLARWVYNNEPTKFAAIELVPKTESDVPETLLGHLNSDGKVTGGIPIPGLASWLSDPSDGTSTVDPRSRLVPGRRAADDAPGEHRPPRVGRDGRARHAAVPAVALVLAVAGSSGATCRKSKLFLRIAAGAGVAAVLAMEAGWVVTEVGRQPWIVRGHMKVEDAATGERGRLDHVHRRRRALRRARRRPSMLVLRSMSRRFRAAGRARRHRRRRTARASCREPTRTRRRSPSVADARRRRAVRRGHRVRALRRRRLRRRVLGPHRRRRRARASDRGRSSTTRSGRCGKPTTSG